MKRAGAVLVTLAILAAARAAGAGGPPIVTVSTGLVLLKDDNTAPIDLRKRYVKFKSRTKFDPVEHQVAMPAAGSAGDPTPAGASGGGATLTVYNPASGESFTVALPASRWIREGNPTPRTYRFSDGDGPIIRTIVRPYKIYVRGGGSGWGYTLDEASQGTVVVRLTLGTGITWCAEASGRVPLESNDRQGKFLSAKSAAPGTCPPLP